MLGWHAEGPFIQMAKRGAHAPEFLLKAEDGLASFEKVYGPENLALQEDWVMACEESADSIGVRIITAAPEITGVRPAMQEAVKRGIVFSIGHSIASTDIAAGAVIGGARLITHLFNAMPQLHHRDPSIIGLLGASPHIILAPSSSVPTSPTSGTFHGAALSRATSSSSLARRLMTAQGEEPKAVSEAFDEIITPPQTPIFGPVDKELRLKKGEVAKMAFERPFYEMIVDGIHSHPNSVRVSNYDLTPWTDPDALVQLAYSAYPEGCILITDGAQLCGHRRMVN